MERAPIRCARPPAQGALRPSSFVVLQTTSASCNHSIRRGSGKLLHSLEACGCIAVEGSRSVRQIGLASCEPLMPKRSTSWIIERQCFSLGGGVPSGTRRTAPVACAVMMRLSLHAHQ